MGKEKSGLIDNNEKYCDSRLTSCLGPSFVLAETESQRANDNSYDYNSQIPFLLSGRRWHGLARNGASSRLRGKTQNGPRGSHSDDNHDNGNVDDDRAG